MTTSTLAVVGRNIDFGPCIEDPDRWSEAEVDDVEARQVCRFQCPRRWRCAAEALKIEPAQGIWSGVFIPTEARERRQAMTQLHSLATHGGYRLPPPRGARTANS